MTRLISRLSRTAMAAVGFGLILTAMSGQASAHFVPEIDPGSIIGGMTLLAGGLAMVLDRRRK